MIYKAYGNTDGYKIYKDGDVLSAPEVVEELTMLRHVVDAINEAAKHGDGTATVICTGVGFNKEVEVNNPRQTAREHAKVELAFADGAKVERTRRDADIEWLDTPNPKWDWDHYNYRIKLKVPRERWVINLAGIEFIHQTEVLAEAKNTESDVENEIIHFREVLKK